LLLLLRVWLLLPLLMLPIMLPSLLLPLLLPLLPLRSTEDGRGAEDVPWRSPGRHDIAAISGPAAGSIGEGPVGVPSNSPGSLSGG
jgi:hypothetical protein